MTRHLPRMAVAAVLTAALLAVGGRRHGSPRVAPVVPPRPASAGQAAAAAVAAEFVAALTRVDAAHPHGDLATLQRLCTPGVLHRLQAVAALPAAVLRASGAQRGTVLAVATRVAGDRAVAQVSAALTDTTDGRPAVRTAAAYTVTLTWGAGRWRVVGVTA